MKLSLYYRMLIAALIVLVQDLNDRGGAQAWNYNYSIKPNRRYDDARRWCQRNYIDMVSIQNQEENDFINNLLPFHSKYYWIGIRKMEMEGNVSWIRARTNEKVEFENWAKNEPDSIKGQDCVEMYVKREDDTGKWNNERCTKTKGTICYTASCKQDSCSAHADCVETVGNFNCSCHPGFQGSRCEEAIACNPLLDLEHGSHSCKYSYGSYRFNSSCRFHCELGFYLEGDSQLLCQASGQWNHPVPPCLVKQCPVLNDSISAGRMNCSHPIALYSYNSTCEVKCDEGYELRGQHQIQCGHTGQWTAPVPSCTVKKCTPILFPVMGNMTCVDTLGTFSFGSQCKFTCQEGYNLTGDNTLTCLASGQWSKPTPTCTVVQCHSLMAPTHASVQCQDPIGVNSYGSMCTVQCKEGFDLIGANMTKCSSQGNWSHALPVCQAKKCPILSAPSHGSLSCDYPHEQFSFGSRCTSTCEEGFVLNGTAETDCTSVGTWSRKIPSCLAHPCPLVVKAPQHGRINCSHPYSPFSFGSFCDFECDEGFRLRGKQTLTCNNTGHWNHDVPTCQPVECGTIRAVSLILSMNCSHPLGHFRFGSSCFFTCKDGFSLNGSDVLFCTSTGSWNDSWPSCAVEGMPLGSALLLYTGVGAASAVAPLLLIGLALLIVKQFKKRGDSVVADAPTWEDRDNPAFEF